MKLSNPKAKKVKAPQPKKPRKDSRIEYTYEEEITYFCPVRGWVTQKVLVKHYRARYAPPLQEHVPRVDHDLKELINETDLSIIEELPDNGDKDGDND